MILGFSLLNPGDVCCAGAFPLSMCWAMCMLVVVGAWMVFRLVVGLFWLCEI